MSSVSAALAIFATASSGCSRVRRDAACGSRRARPRSARAWPSSVLRGGHEHHLGIRRRAVVLDAELVRVFSPRGLEHDALGVPERRHRVDPLGQQPRDRVEADRDLLDLRVVAAVVGDDRLQERRVRRQAGHAHGAAFEILRARHARLRDQRRQRLAHQHADGDEVGALLARDREVVDVEHAEVDLPARHELERVRARRPACGSSAPGRPCRAAHGPALGVKSRAIETGCVFGGEDVAEDPQAVMRRTVRRRATRCISARHRSLSANADRPRAPPLRRRRRHRAPRQHRSRRRDRVRRDQRAGRDAALPRRCAGRRRALRADPRHDQLRLGLVRGARRRPRTG